ncbi:MAG: cupredoxin domain-containing protein [Bacillota bacterium]
MNRQRAILLSVLALLAILLAALMLRGGRPVTVLVTLTDYQIGTSPQVVRRGDLVTLAIRNEGRVEHELEIEGYDLEVEGIQPGETRRLTFRATRAGTFHLVCHLDDHDERGMRAEFRIDES